MDVAQWERENSWSQEKEDWRMDQSYNDFEQHMDKYEKENESIIYEIGLTMFRVTHFVMTAYLVFYVIS